jgi:hypothetical protein
MTSEQLNKILEWLCDNKEWVFSGIGVTVLSFVLCLFKKRNKNTGNRQSSSFNIGSHITQVNGNYTENGKNSK